MSERPISVLLIEDKPDDAAVLEYHLADAPGCPERFAVKTAVRLSTGCRLLAMERFDAVLLDLVLPYCAELEAFNKVHEQWPELPIIVLTGLKGEALARRAVELGAQDYLIKGTLDGPLLKRAIRHAIEKKRLLAEVERLRGVVGVTASACPAAVSGAAGEGFERDGSDTHR